VHGHPDKVELPVPDKDCEGDEKHQGPEPEKDRNGNYRQINNYEDAGEVHGFLPFRFLVRGKNGFQLIIGDTEHRTEPAGKGQSEGAHDGRDKSDRVESPFYVDRKKLKQIYKLE
jgi:hypothetical protein